MSYTNTFIYIAEDCPVETSVVPVSGRAKKTAYEIEYELLSKNPYKFTEEDLLYEIHIRHKELPEDYVSSHADEIRAELFKKPHACLRASQLPKKYGWGIHYDEQGRIAIYGMETEQYREFTQPGEGKPSLLPAMRSKRAK
ncbi:MULTISPECIES: DUF6157 family protein [Paenibacillus]|uniref:DUF6157 family protein n=1 Tax=Paenibacillus TaxID=44249 RepID=UPI00083949A4|nr:MULTISPECIES: DUF6157 family protein [Paenibacillus]GIP21661.1 hypothetical protein J22TS3_19360 [Paenibacillus sp. J22TS3]